jgi:hypothetical protein
MALNTLGRHGADLHGEVIAQAASRLAASMTKAAERRHDTPRG